MFRRRKTEQALSPAVLTRLLDSPQELQIGRLEARRFQFLMVLIDVSDFQELQSIIAPLTDTLIEHSARISVFTSSFLVALLGSQFPQGNTPELRRKLVDTLLRKYGHRIRIAHGQCDGAVGVLGTKRRFAYGEVIPDFSGILNKLLETSVGAAVEIL